MKSLAKLAASALCFFLAPAWAAETVDATDPAKLVSIIQALGYRATLESDGAGDPLIRSSVGGTEFFIYFYRCIDNKDCKVLLFRAGYDLHEGTTTEVVENWNETQLFGTAYLDEESDPWLEMSVNMDGGVTRRNFEDTYDWWEVIVEEFEEHIGF